MKHEHVGPLHHAEPPEHLLKLLSIGGLIRMRVLLSVLLLTFPGVLQGQATQSDSGAIVRVLERFQAALHAGDSSAVLSLLAPDAVILEGGGIETLAEYRKQHLPADISHAKSTARDAGPVSVRIMGPVAWAWSTAETTGTSQGQTSRSVGAELVVLSRTTDGWRIQAIHWSSRRRR